MYRTRVISDAVWALIAPLLPSSDGLRGRPFRDHRPVIEGIVFRFRTGCAWRDVPAEYGPWQTVWKRHTRYSRDGTWDRVLTAILALADARGEIDWTVSADSTIARAHQHATNSTRVESREVVLTGAGSTGGSVELQEFAGLLAACRAA
jgi:transposase